MKQINNFFQCYIILLLYIETPQKEIMNQFWKYIFTSLMEKNCVVVYVILIHRIELAFTSYENQRKKKLNSRNSFYLLRDLQENDLEKTISEVWPKLRFFFGYTKELFFKISAQEPWKVCVK